MKRLSFLAPIAAAVLVAACSSGGPDPSDHNYIPEDSDNEYVPLGRHTTMTKALAHEHLSESALHAPRFQSEGPALAYVRQSLVACPAVIHLRYADTSQKAHMDLASHLQDLIHACGYANEVRFTFRGEFIAVSPHYTDYAYMMAVQTGRAGIGTLGARAQQAYRVAQGMVQKARASSRDQVELARSLHDELVANTRYMPIDRSQYATAVTDTLLSHFAVCESYCHTYALLLNMAGIENTILVGSAGGAPHTWNVARINGVWCHIDCTYDDPSPDRAFRVLHRYFAVGDSAISRNHRWVRGSAPSAPGLPDAVRLPKNSSGGSIPSAGTDPFSDSW